MGLYGSVEAVKQLLRPNEAAVFSEDIDDRLMALQKTVSLLIEHETQRTFGATPAAETVIVNAPGTSPILLLPKPARSITSVIVGGTWNGTAYADGQLVPITDYLLTQRTALGTYLGVSAVYPTSYWYGVIAVTGVWDDAPMGAVPDDVTYIANYLMAEQFKIEEAGPHGIVGSDGQTIQVRKLFSLEIVRKTLDHYRLAPAVVV